VKKLKIKVVVSIGFIIGGVLFSLASITKCKREVFYIWKGTFDTLRNLEIKEWK